MFLQIGTAAHIRAKAWATSFGRSVNLRHVDLFHGFWYAVWKKLLTMLEVGDGGVAGGLPSKVPCDSPAQARPRTGWIDRHLTLVSDSSPTSDLFPASKLLQLKCPGIGRELSSSKNDQSSLALSLIFYVTNATQISIVTDLESSATVKSVDLQSFVADADLSLSYSAWIQFVRVQQRVMVLLNVLA